MGTVSVFFILVGAVCLSVFTTLGDFSFVSSVPAVLLNGAAVLAWGYCTWHARVLSEKNEPLKKALGKTAS